MAQGGSTITQQLTKVVFLSPERKITRKIKEIILARRLEKELTKEEILELYLNKVYFGHGAYGVQMASKTYFGKNIWEVNQAEAALLAGLPKSPTAYSPYSDIDLTKLRQWHVLKRMVAEGYLTEEQSKKIYDQPLNLENLRTQEEVAPFIVDYIRKYIEKKYGPDKLYQGGLKVYTTIDLDIQRTADMALKEGLRALDKRQGFRGRVGFKQLKSAPIQWGSLHVMVKPGEVIQRPCARGRRLLYHGQGPRHDGLHYAGRHGLGAHQAQEGKGRLPTSSRNQPNIVQAGRYHQGSIEGLRQEEATCLVHPGADAAG